MCVFLNLIFPQCFKDVRTKYNNTAGSFRHGEKQSFIISSS